MPSVENRGAKIYWDEQGEGEPMLLIMGIGYPSDLWYRSRPELSARYRTIALDNRGVGRSDVPPGPYTMPLMASDAAAVLDAAMVESAHIFGASMGGMIAQEFALQYPKRVRSLLLACTQPGGVHAVPAKADVLITLMSRPQMTPEQAAAAFIPFLYHPSTPRERIDEDMAVLRHWVPTPAGFNAQLQAILAWEAYSRLPTITAPTLVLHGDCDLLVPPENGKLIAAQIPGAKLVMIPNASHMFVTDQPQASREAVTQFLAQLEKPGAQSARVASNPGGMQL